ncbi:hypothetical protein DYB26_004850 [Aphanomyces astaci]|uniref:subtilisin n=3 Tax=Aphanomyces astaci TaxID=112090 RepID=A0A397EKE6_APHAT|nr:hypothetical protein DYB31_000959 [Aphanomyces astaci]RHZ29989.1 hypothetical protein DYB26_004850 [Aphanomyces astaci]
MVRIASLAAAFTATAAATISHRTLRELEIADETEIMVRFVSPNSLAKLDTESLPREDRALAVFSTLSADSAIATAAGVELAKAAGVEYTAYWIDTLLYIKGAKKDLVDQLSGLPSVESIGPVEVYDLPVIKEDGPHVAVTNSTVEWGVTIIGAPTAWARGNKGKGIVVASIDTGVRLTHETLQTNFRSANGWYEPSTKSKLPNDRHGHGTHVTGTIAGLNGIGVAPEAKWIACAGCPAGSCPQTDLLACAQYITCPTDTDGNNPDCKLAPHVVNNSWGSRRNGDTWYEASIQAWRKAGIIPVFSNGNAGPGCGTVGVPGESASVIGVGATDSADLLASFSSKGPVPNRTLIKPDVSAPGRLVRSAGSASDTAYATFSGTSMASPHVAGAVALILNANPGASYDTVYKLLATTADTASLKPSGANCGGVSDSKYPNNDFGYGRINANKASTTKPAC